MKGDKRYINYRPVPFIVWLLRKLCWHPRASQYLNYECNCCLICGRIHSMEDAAKEKGEA